jgi:hypothetical protein
MPRGLDSLTRKPWFYVLLISCSFFLPPITSQPYRYYELPRLMMEILVNGLLPYVQFAPIFHIATILFVIALWKKPHTTGRVFYFYLAINFIFIALAQNITNTPSFGNVILLSNVFLFLVVGIFWLMGAIRPQQSLTPHKGTRWRFLGLPFAALAFWSPMDYMGNPNFSPINLLTSDYGLAFCFTVPVFLYILSFFYATIYQPAFRVTCVFGLFMGILNITGPLWLSGYPLWVAFLHIPLLLLTTYGILLGRISRGVHSS